MANAAEVFADTNKAAVREYRELLDERDSIQGETDQSIAPPAFIDSAVKFLSVVDPEPEWIIGDLIPRGVLALLHGEPRTRKSWAALDIAIAASTGTPAFGLARFSSRPSRVLYSSQEDGAALIRPRAKALLRGRGIEGYPDLLSFAVHKAINLDNVQWQTALLTEIAAREIDLVILDPIRRYSAAADKGPSDVQRITAFLKRIATELSRTVLIVHHDVKPPAQGKDERRRAHRASGGDWFAASECPISLETAGETRTLAYPTAYKTTTDPAPFSFSVESDDPRRPTTARLVGEDTTADEASTLATDEAVISYLTGNPGKSGRAIAKAIRKGYEPVSASLERLLSDRVDCVDMGRGRGKVWTIKR